MREIVLLAVDSDVVGILGRPPPAREHIGDGQEVGVANGKSLFGGIRLGLESKGSDEWRFGVQRGSDGQGRIQTSEDGSCYDELAKVHVHW